MTRKYRLLKTITIALGAIYPPLSFYAGYCIGSGDTLRGLISLIGYSVLCLIDGHIYWHLIEARTKI